MCRPMLGRCGLAKIGMCVANRGTHPTTSGHKSQHIRCILPSSTRSIYASCTQDTIGTIHANICHHTCRSVSRSNFDFPVSPGFQSSSFDGATASRNDCHMCVRVARRYHAASVVSGGGCHAVVVCPWHQCRACARTREHACVHASMCGSVACMHGLVRA